MITKVTAADEPGADQEIISYALAGGTDGPAVRHPPDRGNPPFVPLVWLLLRR